MANFLQMFYVPIFVFGFLQTCRVLQVEGCLHENAYLFSKDFLNLHIIGHKASQNPLE